MEAATELYNTPEFISKHSKLLLEATQQKPTEKDISVEIKNYQERILELAKIIEFEKVYTAELNLLKEKNESVSPDMIEEYKKKAMSLVTLRVNKILQGTLEVFKNGLQNNINMVKIIENLNNNLQYVLVRNDNGMPTFVIKLVIEVLKQRDQQHDTAEKTQLRNYDRITPAKPEVVNNKLKMAFNKAQKDLRKAEKNLTKIIRKSFNQNEIDEASNEVDKAQKCLNKIKEKQDTFEQQKPLPGCDDPII